MTPQIGVDPVDGDEFRSDIHRVVAARADRENGLTHFVRAAGDIAAAWPTKQIICVFWAAPAANSDEPLRLATADPDQTTAPGPSDPLDRTSDAEPLGDPLPVRALNALRQRGITTWHELTDLDPDELAALPNVGEKTLRDIAAALTSRTAKEAPAPRTPLTADALQDELRAALHEIGERNRLVIIARVLRSPPVTLQDLGRQLLITRERVRQIEGKAIGKLKRVVRRNKGAAAQLITQLDLLEPTDEEHAQTTLLSIAPPGTSQVALALVRRLAGY